MLSTENELRGHRYKLRKQKTRSEGCVQVGGRVTIPRLDTGVEVSMVKFLLFVLLFGHNNLFFGMLSTEEEVTGIRQES